MKKAWFMAPMEYRPNGKGILMPMKHAPMVDSPNGKGMVFWMIHFLSGNGFGKI